MSIIHDALKKAQSSLKPHPPAPVSVSATPDPIPSDIRTIKTEAPSSFQESKPMISMRHVLMILIPICVIVAGQPFMMMFLSSSDSSSPPAPVSQPVSPVSLAPAITQNPAPAMENNNPVSPTTNAAIEETPPRVQPMMVLNGLSTAGSKPLALINNEVLGLGDEIYGMKIMSITASGVELQDGDQKMILKKRQ